MRAAKYGRAIADEVSRNGATLVRRWSAAPSHDLGAQETSTTVQRVVRGWRRSRPLDHLDDFSAFRPRVHVGDCPHERLILKPKRKFDGHHAKSGTLCARAASQHDRPRTLRMRHVTRWIARARSRTERSAARTVATKLRRKLARVPPRRASPSSSWLPSQRSPSLDLRRGSAR